MNDNLHYEHYLLGLNHTDKTIKQHLLNQSYFESWATDNGITVHVNTPTVLAYVQHMQKNELTVGTVNNRLNSLRKYFDHLIDMGMLTQNPAKGQYIKGKIEKVVQNELSGKDLNQLYSEYATYIDSKPRRSNIPNQQKTNERYKLIVSLMVFQGLHTGELDKLTKQDVNVDEGTIYIPSTTRSNSRVLKLDACQTIPFYKYLDKLPSNQDKLFSICVQKSHAYILAELKGINPMIRNAQHIRASVLLNWIKMYDKRKAQYMIGHKFVSTTEKYESQDTTELGEMVDKVHLFG